MVELSEFFNGKDHNGDGVGDFGFCFTPQPNYFYVRTKTDAMPYFILFFLLH